MKRLILLLILCPVLALGQTSARRDSLRITACYQVGLPIAGTAAVTTAMMNNAINYAVQRVSTDFPAIEKIDTLVLRDTAQGVALPSDLFQIKWCQMMFLDTLVPLEYITEDELYSKRNLSVPRYYYTQADRLLTWPRLREEMYDLDSALVFIGYYAIDSALASDSAETDIPEDYRDELIDYICYQLEMMRYRYESAAFYAARYEKAKAEARAGK